MSKIIDFTSGLKNEPVKHSAVYAVINIPAVYTQKRTKRPGIFRLLAWTVDVAVSLGLGAMLLAFLLLLIISL